MLSGAYAKKQISAEDPVFSAPFYVPYEAALAAGLSILEAARAAMPLDVLTLSSRLKSGASIRGKLQRKQLPQTSAAAGAALRDIAGLRAVLTTRDAVYRYAGLLSQTLDLEDIHDYIAAPKPSGYRSLHMIIEVPIFLSKEKRYMRVEVQLRTIAMDFWASLEHKLHYKNDISQEYAQEIAQQLCDCAQIVSETDQKMLAIRRQIEGEYDL